MTDLAPPDHALRDRIAERNRRTITGLILIVGLMVGASYAAVPLYDLFCRVTGFGGTTQVSTLDEGGVVLDREVTVAFTADAAPGLDWSFEADVRSIDVKLGEGRLAFFRATNTTDTPLAGTAVYNVTPHKTGIYFAKVQCFCFDEQILMPGETVEFPVYFFVDPLMDEDVALDEIKHLTLSYTFFPSNSAALDAAREEYYRTSALSGS